MERILLLSIRGFSDYPAFFWLQLGKKSGNMLDVYWIVNLQI